METTGTKKGVASDGHSLFYVLKSSWADWFSISVREIIFKRIKPKIAAVLATYFIRQVIGNFRQEFISNCIQVCFCKFRHKLKVIRSRLSHQTFMYPSHLVS